MHSKKYIDHDNYTLASSDGIYLIMKWIKRYLLGLCSQEYLRIMGRLAVNSFALRVINNNEEENVGTGTVYLRLFSDF